MGEEITSYFELNGSENLDRLKQIMGIKGTAVNIIASIAEYYCEGKAKASDTHAMSEAVSAFMMENKKHANKISQVVELKERETRTSCRKYYAR